MRKLALWEYKTILFTDESSLNKLGKEGWECVCPAGKEGNYLVFRRQIEGEGGYVSTGGGSEDAQKAPTKKSYKEFI